MKVARRSQAGSFLDQLTPEISLKEVGALLGLSDSCAMRMERSAGQKIEQAMRRLNLSSVSEFVRLDEGKFEAAFGSAAGDEQEYSERAGWYAITHSRSMNEGTGSIRDAVVSGAVLRLLRKACWVVPLLCRRPGQRYKKAGSADTVIMLGERAVFRSMDLKRVLRDEALEFVQAIAILESERGSDEHGVFEVPLIRAIAVTCH